MSRVRLYESVFQSVSSSGKGEKKEREERERNVASFFVNVLLRRYIYIYTHTKKIDVYVRIEYSRIVLCIRGRDRSRRGVVSPFERARVLR